MQKELHKTPISPTSSNIGEILISTAETLSENLGKIKQLFKKDDVIQNPIPLDSPLSIEHAQIILDMIANFPHLDEMRTSITSGVLKQYGLDDFIDVSAFNSICKENNLSLAEGIKVFRILKDSDYHSKLYTLSKQDYSMLKTWDIKTLGNVPDLAALNSLVTLTDYRSLKLKINRSSDDICQVLQILHRCHFPKSDLFNLETEDFAALLECKNLANYKYITVYDRYHGMSNSLRYRLGCWLDKSSKMVVGIDKFANTASIGELLYYFTKLSSESLPTKIKYTLHLLRAALYCYTGIVLPDPKVIYLAAIWFVMLSLMTQYANFSEFELGATIIVIMSHIISFELNDGQVNDISKLISSDTYSWSDLSNDTIRTISDEHKEMIDAWNQTLEVLIDANKINISNSFRMLLTYSIGTSYIRYISRPFDIKALFDAISLIPTKYSLHNIVKLFRSDDEYYRRLKLINGNGHEVVDNEKLKLAFAPQTEYGRRGEFCKISNHNSAYYYPAVLSDIHKEDLKIHVTSTLQAFAPIHCGQIIEGMLDAEDIFAEETQMCGHKVSVKHNAQIYRYARLVAHCYGKESIYIEDCKVIEKKHSNNDLRAVIYAYGDNDIICAFAGTSTKKDVINDILQPFGISPQYKDALEYGREVCQKYKNKNIVFIGHSMGGGEAVYCALECRKPAFTFNPAGLGGMTLADLNLSNYSREDLHKIHAYIFRGDVLNAFQDICEGLGILDISADGVRYDVYDYIPQKISIDELHGMKGILSYFELNVTSEPKIHHIKLNSTEYKKNNSSVTEMLIRVNGVSHYGEYDVMVNCFIMSGSISQGDKVYLFRHDDAMIMCNTIKSILIDGNSYNTATAEQAISIVLNGPFNSISQCVSITNNTQPLKPISHKQTVPSCANSVYSPPLIHTELSVLDIFPHEHNSAVLRCTVNKGNINNGDKIYLYRRKDSVLIVTCKVKCIWHNNIECNTAIEGDEINILIDIPFNNVSQCDRVER